MDRSAAALALLLQRRPKESGEELLANAALRALQATRVVEFETVGGERKRVVPQASDRARKVLKALKIKKEAAAGGALRGERNRERPRCSDNSKMKALVNKGKTCHNR